MQSKPKIWVINGPNLNKLGSREPDIYGKKTLEDINAELLSIAKDNSVSIDFFQSNHEGEIVEVIHSADQIKVESFIINLGALTHTSISIRDALKAINNTSFIEIHLSNIFAREEFRHFSYFSDIAKGIISGLGYKGYVYALNYLIEEINGSEKT